MTSSHLVTFFLSLGFAAVVTPLVMWFARKKGIVDDPSTAPDRKHHTRPIPLLGGVAIILATWMSWGIMYLMGALPTIDISMKSVVGVVLGGGILLIGGVLDDRYRLPAKHQIWWVLVAAMVTVISGIGVTFITNPFGGLIYLNGIQWTIGHIGSTPYHITLWADLFTLVWILGATYTTKILDGLDGLVSGLGLIGAVIIFLLTLRPEVQQSGVGLLAASLAGACAGFLIWNWHPAKIFLGESGSLYIGFLLGTLAIISGGKIATALLILGLPILDLLWVIIQRLRSHQSPFTSGDRLHLHYRLLDAGLSTRQSVLLIFALVALFGMSTLYVSGVMKVVTLVALLVVMALIVWWVMRRIHQRQQTPT